MPTEIAPPVVTATMTEEIARHLRLSTPLSAEDAAEAEAAFRAALAHLETELGLCLAPRAFEQRGYLDDEGALAAETAPVRALTAATRVINDGSEAALELSLFSLDRRATRTVFCCHAFVCEEIVLTYEAGFGADWSATPADLRRAVLQLTAELYDVRHAAGVSRPLLPFGVAELIRPWRPLRLGGWGRA